MQLLEIEAIQVKIGDQFYFDGRFWEVLGIAQVAADSGETIHIWMRGSSGIEEITRVEWKGEEDKCIIKRRSKRIVKED